MEKNNIEVTNMGVLQRFFGVIFAPVKTMKDIDRKPNFLVVFILVMVVALAFSIITFNASKDFMLEESMKSIEKMEEKGVEYPEESKELVMKIADVTAIATPIIIVFSTGISILIVAAVSLLFMKVILKGEGDFKRYFSVATYASVILIISYIVKIILFYITNDYSTVMFATSLKGILPNNQEMNFINTFASWFEIFNIWSFIVTGIGLKVVSKLSNMKVIIFVAGAYLLMTLYMLFAALMTGVSYGM